MTRLSDISSLDGFNERSLLLLSAAIPLWSIRPPMPINTNKVFIKVTSSRRFHASISTMSVSHHTSPVTPVWLKNENKNIMKRGRANQWLGVCVYRQAVNMVW